MALWPYAAAPFGLFNPAGGGSPSALECGGGRPLTLQKRERGMVADVCCGFKKEGVGWWWTSAGASKRGARWCWFLAENGMGVFGMA